MVGPSPSPGPVTRVACQAPPASEHHVAPAQSPRDCPKIRRTSWSPPRPGCCDPVFEKPSTQWVLPDPALAESTLLKGKLRRPTHPKTADLHSFGDYCRGDGPRAGNGTRILFKNNGAGTAPQYRHALGRVARPGQAPQAGQTSRPGKTRRLGPNNWRKTAEHGTAKASSPSQRHPWRATQSSHGSTPVPSRPYDGDETSINDDRGNSATPMPLVSRNMAIVPLTYPLTRAGVATMPPPSPLTTESSNLTESTVRGLTRPCPEDQQDGAQSP